MIIDFVVGDVAELSLVQDVEAIVAGILSPIVIVRNVRQIHDLAGVSVEVGDSLLKLAVALTEFTGELTWRTAENFGSAVTFPSLLLEVQDIVGDPDTGVAGLKVCARTEFRRILECEYCLRLIDMRRRHSHFISFFVFWLIYKYKL